MRSHDRDTVIRLRHQLQTCESSKRQAWRALDDFRQHLMAAGQTIPMIEVTTLLGELAELRLLLAGVGKGGE